MFNSFRQHISNRRPATQIYLSSIHDALLQSLAYSADLVDRQDYHPGEIRISQKVFWSFSVLLRLFVTRNGVDIFMER